MAIPAVCIAWGLVLGCQEGSMGSCMVGQRQFCVLIWDRHAAVKVDKVSMEYGCGGHVGGAPTNGRKCTQSGWVEGSPQVVGEVGGWLNPNPEGVGKCPGCWLRSLGKAEEGQKEYQGYL